MKKILHVISSPSGASFSRQLGNAIIEKIQAANPVSTVQERDLAKQHFPHLEEAHITSFFTPAESRTEDHTALMRRSDEAIRELQNADIIVIDTPVYNYNINSALKAWIDHIVRSGVTFRYDANGPQGLLKDKKVFVAIASGAVFSEGPMMAMDYIAPYLRTILGFIGITDVSIFRVEGTAMPGLKEHALEKGISSITLN